MSKGPRVEIIDSPIPTAGPDQIVTRVIISGCNPKDWKVWTCQIQRYQQGRLMFLLARRDVSKGDQPRRRYRRRRP